MSEQDPDGEEEAVDGIPQAPSGMEADVPFSDFEVMDDQMFGRLLDVVDGKTSIEPHEFAGGEAAVVLSALAKYGPGGTEAEPDPVFKSEAEGEIVILDRAVRPWR